MMSANTPSKSGRKEAGSGVPEHEVRERCGMALLLLTAASPVVPSPRPSHLNMLKRSLEQEQAKRQFLFWQKGCDTASIWSTHWAPSPYWPSLTSLGEDLLASVDLHVDSQTQCRLAASCRSLRHLLLPRLQKMMERALRRVVLSGALGS